MAASRNFLDTADRGLVRTVWYGRIRGVHEQVALVLKLVATRERVRIAAAASVAFGRAMRAKLYLLSVGQIGPTGPRRASGRRGRVTVPLSELLFLFAVGLSAIQDYSYEIAPMDGVDYAAAALPNDGVKDFSKHEKAFRRNPGEVVGSRSVDALSATARSALLKCRDQHPLPPKLLPSPERRASGNASTDPH